MRYKIKTGRPKKWETPEQLKVEVLDYFKEVDENGSMPTKSGLSLHLGVCIDTIDAYKNDYGLEFANVIKKTYEAIANAWSQRLSGTVPTGAIFYLKAAFHYKDRYDVTSDDKPIEGNKIIFENFKKEEEDATKG